MKHGWKRISAQSPLPPEWLSELQMMCGHQSGRIRWAGSDPCFSWFCRCFHDSVAVLMFCLWTPPFLWVTQNNSGSLGIWFPLLSGTGLNSVNFWKTLGFFKGQSSNANLELLRWNLPGWLHPFLHHHWESSSVSTAFLKQVLTLGPCLGCVLIGHMTTNSLARPQTGLGTQVLQRHTLQAFARRLQFSLLLGFRNREGVDVLSTWCKSRVQWVSQTFLKTDWGRQFRLAGFSTESWCRRLWITQVCLWPADGRTDPRASQMGVAWIPPADGRPRTEVLAWAKRRRTSWTGWPCWWGHSWRSTSRTSRGPPFNWPQVTWSLCHSHLKH